MFCPKCGTKNKSGAIFCVKCGNKLGTDSNTSKSKTGKSPINAKTIGAIIVVIVIVGALLLFFNGSGNQQSRIRSQLCKQNPTYCNASVVISNSSVSTTIIPTTTIHSTSTVIATTQTTSSQSTTLVTTVATTQTTSSRSTTILPKIIKLQCSPTIDFTCEIPQYNTTGQFIQVSISQFTSVTWSGYDIVYVPNGTPVNSSGLPRTSFTSYPAETYFQNLTWTSGTGSVQILPVTQPYNLNGTIWIRYTLQGSSTPLYVEIGTISPSGSSSYYTTAPTTTINYPSTYYTTTIQQTQSYGCSPIPCSYTKNGNFTFLFYLLNGSVAGWYFPVTSYNYYVSTPRVDPIIRLNDSGKTVYTYDYRGLVTPSFFVNVTPKLTNGKTAQQFIQEVKSVKNQLTGYSTVFLNSSVYAPEVLGAGEGDCKDLGVLMASILEAGNKEAGYGMNISFEYVDAYNLTDPHTSNHLILFITFANGTSEYLDTTNVLPNTTIVNVTGWRYPLICNSTSCQTATLCSGAYCDAVGYYNGNNAASCTQSGYVVGADDLCHIDCNVPNDYCNSGYSCIGNYCR